MIVVAANPSEDLAFWRAVMRISIIADAVGGCLGERMAAAGPHVTFVARGAHREAIHRDGLPTILRSESAAPVSLSEQLSMLNAVR